MNKQTFWESEVYTLREQIQLIETERNNLERENAALRADKERLDWLQNATYWPHPPLGEDIRASIDAAARKEQP